MIWFGALLTAVMAHAQDSVEVVFRYKPALTTPSIVFVPGEFNGWGPNSNGYISPAAPSRMDFDAPTGTWIKAVRLRVGFAGTAPKGIAGAYQYKFNEGGSTWLADPLNPRINSSDAGNSYLYPTDPTIYQFVPNQVSGMVKTSNPVISAYLFPKIGSTLDTAALSLRVDSTLYRGIGKSYDPLSKKFSLTSPIALSNGIHRAWLTVGGVTDSVSFVVQAGAVQITNLGNYTTRKSTRIVYGALEDTSIHSVRLVRNGIDTMTVSAAGGQFEASVPLVEGLNVLKAVIRSQSGSTQVSDPVSISYFVNHAPTAEIFMISTGSGLVINAQGSSDPDVGQAEQLKFRWSADAANPQSLTTLSGATTAQVVVPLPNAKGDYFFTLVAEDPDGNKDTTRSYFTVLPNGGLETTSFSSSPRWARQGRLYELFFKSMTPQGTIRAALPYLPYFRSIGVNILWVMPVMENAAPMNNRSGTGYNIKNFFKVAPEYGTNDDFKEFVRQAHAQGLRVILDVTPNHTSYMHPFVVEARQYRKNSPYWDYYQHTVINHNTNGLGQSTTSDGFVYYSGFSNQLLNYNWSDVDARTCMIEVYKWWVKEFDLDGYRFDVYWGPHRRAGGGAGNELEMGNPVRKALRKIKPDIFLLAEDDGTGSGTEVIFGDRNGGVDAGYDWALYGGAIKPFAFEAASIENLHSRYYNSNFYPGPNALFLRFMENHDEDRIVAVPSYGSYEKTMPLATSLFTVPGLPMIYSGQEVGFGLGISDYDGRRRGVIDWNASGKATLLRHYQRLAQIRSQFSALWTQKLYRLQSGSPYVYAYVRPDASGDAVVAVNFSGTAQPVQLTLTTQTLESQTTDGKPYYLNDLYNDTSYVLAFQGGQSTLAALLPPYGSLICVKSDSMKRLTVSPLVSVEKEGLPEEFRLNQNYPNPFNPSTTISYQVSSVSLVRLSVSDLLGRTIATLVERTQGPGSYTVRWNAEQFPSGMYFCRLIAEDQGYGGKSLQVRTIKMLLLK